MWLLKKSLQSKIDAIAMYDKVTCRVFKQQPIDLQLTTG